jgi:hypothetical protein
MQVLPTFAAPMRTTLNSPDSVLIAQKFVSVCSILARDMREIAESDGYRPNLLNSREQMNYLNGKTSASI